jgi:hypothetical protein
MNDTEVTVASLYLRVVALFAVFLLVAARVRPVMEPAGHRQSGVAVPRC